MEDESNYYEYDDIEIAKMACAEIKDVIKKYGSVLKKRRSYKHLEYYYEELNKDVGGEDE